jgi:hypothetical protein
MRAAKVEKDAEDVCRVACGAADDRHGESAGWLWGSLELVRWERASVRV